MARRQTKPGAGISLPAGGRRPSPDPAAAPAGALPEDAACRALPRPPAPGSMKAEAALGGQPRALRPPYWVSARQADGGSSPSKVKLAADEAAAGHSGAGDRRPGAVLIDEPVQLNGAPAGALTPFRADPLWASAFAAHPLRSSQGLCVVLKIPRGESASRHRSPWSRMAYPGQGGPATRARELVWLGAAVAIGVSQSALPCAHIPEPTSEADRLAERLQRSCRAASDAPNSGRLVIVELGAMRTAVAAGTHLSPVTRINHGRGASTPLWKTAARCSMNARTAGGSPRRVVKMRCTIPS